MRKIYFFLTIFSALVLASCSDDDDTVSSSAKFEGSIENVSALGQTVTVKVVSDTKWTISKSEGADWFHVTPFTSTGNEDIKVEVEPTLATEMRQGVIYLSTETGLTDSLTVKQNTLTFPAVPGAIEGQTAADYGQTITLTADSVTDAQAYVWYRNGEAFEETAGRTLDVMVPGKYQVSAKNSLGESDLSPEKELTFSTDIVLDQVESAEYIGSQANGYSYSYQMVLTKKIDNTTEIGFFGTFTDDKPADADNAWLSTRDYKICDPYKNNFKFEGRCEGNDEYSLTPWSGDPYGSYFFIKKNGSIVPLSVTYLHKDETNSIKIVNNNGHYTIKGENLKTWNAIIKTEVSDWGSVSRSIVSREERPDFSLSFEGDITFANEGIDQMSFSYKSPDQFTGDYTNTDCQTIGISYYPKEPGVWRIGIGEQAGLDGSGWEASADFYPENNSDITGLYVIGQNADKQIPGTVQRGFMRYNTYGTGLIAMYWVGLTRKSIVFGQPARNSYMRIEKTGASQYRVTLVIVDELGHKVTLGGEQVVEFTPVSNSN